MLYPEQSMFGAHSAARSCRMLLRRKQQIGLTTI